MATVPSPTRPRPQSRALTLARRQSSCLMGRPDTTLGSQARPTNPGRVCLGSTGGHAHNRKKVCCRKTFFLCWICYRNFCLCMCRRRFISMHSQHRPWCMPQPSRCAAHFCRKTKVIQHRAVLRRTSSSMVPQLSQFSPAHRLLYHWSLLCQLKHAFLAQCPAILLYSPVRFVDPGGCYGQGCFLSVNFCAGLAGSLWRVNVNSQRLTLGPYSRPWPRGRGICNFL